jgi:titin
MLFLLNSAGVPSVAPIVRLSADIVPSPPTAPTNLSASAVSSSQIDLSWTDNASDETGFRIERSPDGTTFAEIATVGANVTSYANTGLTAATQYWYRVRAYNSTGASGYAGPASATTLAAAVAPTAPTNLTASAVSSSQINLTWTDTANNETGFRIERSPDGTTFAEIATAGANVTSYANTTGLTAATQYWYRVRAYNTTGTSSYAGPASATTLAPEPQPPSAPTALIVTSRSDGMALTWTDTSSNETGFAIFRSTDDGRTYTQIATVAQNVSTYVDSSPGATKFVYYRVRAFNTFGNSAFSTAVKMRNR